jgi:SNF2 family DNA or RNA helicase
MQLDVTETHLILTGSVRFKDLVLKIPGMNYWAMGDCWRAPKAWGIALACRGVLGEYLELTPEAIAWAEREKDHCRLMESIRSGGGSARSAGVEGLHSFQKIGVDFLIYSRHAALFDDMGLGKTVQACVALGHTPALIVCPNSMAITWQRELTQWAGIDAVVVRGTKAQREKTILSGAEAIIINWESLRTHSRLAPFGSIALKDEEKAPGALNQVQWKTVIADECHRAKDPKAKQTRALWAVSAEATNRWALTGTPMDGKAEDLWSVMHFVCPEEWPSKSRWIDRYTLNGMNQWGAMETYGFNPQTHPELQAFLRPRMIRRTKAEVLPTLPPKVYATRWVAMDSKQAKAYKSMQKEMLAELESGLLIAGDDLTNHGRLSQIACAMPVLDAEGKVVSLDMPSCKVDALLEVIDECNGEALVVGSESRKLIELCARQLEKHKITYSLIVGGMSGPERQMAIDQFQQGAVQVCLVSLGAGAEGLTLTRASRLVRLQGSYRSLINNQFEDRIHRIGQEADSVLIIDILTENSIDSDRLEASHAKEEVGQQVLQDPEWVRKVLTR